MQLALNQPFTRVFFIGGVASPPYASFRIVTGLTIAIQISKGGAAFADPHAGPSNLTEIALGFYKFALAPQDTDTKGCLGYSLTWGGPGFFDGDVDQVVTALPGDPGELTNPERDAVAAAVLGLSNGVDTGVSLAHAMMAITAFLTGKTPMFGPITRYRNWADTKDRVTMTTDPVSGRLSVVFDFS